MCDWEPISDSTEINGKAIMPSHALLSCPLPLELFSLEGLLINRGQCARRLRCSAHVQLACGEGNIVTLVMLTPPGVP